MLVVKFKEKKSLKICDFLKLGCVVADKLVPSFTWIRDNGTEAGVPHLAIHFHDGKPDDIAILKRFNPFPKRADETEESIDQCIFTGYLLFENDVNVTLTGGCPFEDSFEVCNSCLGIHESS